MGHPHHDRGRDATGGRRPRRSPPQLACRFLHWHGPAGPGHFAKWAGVTREDAEATWRSLADEIVPIAVGGRGRWLLRSDLDALVDIEPASVTA
ncbi:MAG: DNA glycosylase AlkZ-like family protein [Acidimicrobiales bacterium]